MRLKPKEKAKLDTRRKMWKLFDWHWAHQRTDGGYYKTDYTSNEDECKGYGYFKHNHSLSCTDHATCRMQLSEKRRERKRDRRLNKKEDRNLMKVINCHGEIE